MKQILKTCLTYLKTAFNISRRKDSGSLASLRWPLSHRARSTQWWPCLPWLKINTQYNNQRRILHKLTLPGISLSSGTDRAASNGDVSGRTCPPGGCVRRCCACQTPDRSAAGRTGSWADGSAPRFEGIWWIVIIMFNYSAFNDSKSLEPHHFQPTIPTCREFKLCGRTVRESGQTWSLVRILLIFGEEKYNVLELCTDLTKTRHTKTHFF